MSEGIFFFPDSWQVSSVVCAFTNVGERSVAKSYHPIILSVVSRISEKLVNSRLANHLENLSFFSDFKYGFRCSRSRSGLLEVVYTLDISKAFNRV